MTSITITLPLPSRDLSPNSRCHWRKKAAAAKRARCMAHALALEQLAGRTPPRWKHASEQLAFFLPDFRRRDQDNMEAACKHYRDGLKDAAVITDDNWTVLTRLPSMIQVDRKNPRLEITIAESPLPKDPTP